MELKRYTVDDEDPNCGRCDHVCDGFDCCGMCGPEHGWFGYSRTEREELE